MNDKQEKTSEGELCAISQICLRFKDFHNNFSKEEGIQKEFTGNSQGILSI
jgi:hypothetical protein